MIDILQGDCRQVLKSLPEKSINCCVTSPPYWGLRDYGVEGQLGLEPTPEEYIENMVDVFRGVHRVLKDDGTLWINIGDSYCGYKGGNYGKTKGNLTARTLVADKERIDICTPQTSGLKAKDLVGIPWMLAFALRADGWYLRQDIIWSKSNPMPESVKDRCTKSHEYIFLLSKSSKYYYDIDSLREPCGEEKSYSPGSRLCKQRNGDRLANNHLPGNQQEGLKTGFKQPVKWNNPKGRNKRSVWITATSPFPEAHFATFPIKLIEPCILAGCPEGGTVIDPFGGSGTTGEAAIKHRRNAILIELNPEYIELQKKRTSNVQRMLM